MHGLIYAREFGFDAQFEIGIARKAAIIAGSDDPFDCIWIKEVDAQRAGSIAVSRMEDGAAFINFVLVLDESRGRGIALELIAAYNRRESCIRNWASTLLAATGIVNASVRY